MYIVGLAVLDMFRLDKRIEVIDHDTVFVHNKQRDVVVFDFIASDTSFGTFGDRSRRPPDETCTGLFQTSDKSFEVFGVLLRWCNLFSFGGQNLFATFIDVLQIVQTPVEMDHIPFVVAKPLVDLLESLHR